MTVLSTADQIEVDEPRHFITGPIRDAMAVAWRNLRALPRIPQYLVFSTIHTNDAPSAVARLHEMGSPTF